MRRVAPEHDGEHGGASAGDEQPRGGAHERAVAGAVAAVEQQAQAGDEVGGEQDEGEHVIHYGPPRRSQLLSHWVKSMALMRSMICTVMAMTTAAARKAATPDSCRCTCRMTSGAAM